MGLEKDPKMLLIQFHWQSFMMKNKAKINKQTKAKKLYELSNIFFRNSFY